MREKETLKRFVSELKVNLEEIENPVLVQVLDDLENVKVSRDKPYYRSMVNSLGKSLHDFYDAIQVLLFERVADETGEGRPRAEQYHKVLLRNMSSEIEGIRPPVISKATYEKLEEYLGFRHLFRHTYGYRLEEDRFIHLAEAVQEVFRGLKEEVVDFCQRLEEGDS